MRSPKNHRSLLLQQRLRRRGAQRRQGSALLKGAEGANPQKMIPDTGGAPESNAAKALAKLIQQVDPASAVACVDDELGVTM